MEVFLVYHGVQYEFNDVIGVFDAYHKARSFELDFLKDRKIYEDEWTEIRKVEVNKQYSRFDGEIGVEV